MTDDIKKKEVIPPHPISRDSVPRNFATEKFAEYVSREAANMLDQEKIKSAANAVSETVPEKMTRREAFKNALPALGELITKTLRNFNTPE